MDGAGDAAAATGRLHAGPGLRAADDGHAGCLQGNEGLEDRAAARSGNPGQVVGSIQRSAAQFMAGTGEYLEPEAVAGGSALPAGARAGAAGARRVFSDALGQRVGVARLPV